MRFPHCLAILAAVIYHQAAAVLAQDPAGQGTAETPVEEGESSLRSRRLLLPPTCCSAVLLPAASGVVDKRTVVSPCLPWRISDTEVHVNRCCSPAAPLHVTPASISACCLILQQLGRVSPETLPAVCVCHPVSCAAEEADVDNTYWIYTHAVLMSLGWVALLPRE
jgi:hypothetical protein